MKEKDYLVALSAFEDFGPVRVKLLLSYFKAAREIWDASARDLEKVGIKKNLVEKFVQFRSGFDIKDYLRSLRKQDVRPVTINASDYPANLKDLADAPSVLYVKGALKQSDSNSVAIVGTRMMTSYGREVANKLAAELADYGVTIISGLALGIDAEAQRAAIRAGGRTISVLASGLDIISPLANKSLALSFIGSSGAIVSEKPLGHVPFPSDFPVRDRLISGLAKAVIVAEGRMKSGTFYTVKAATDQGRPVFAVPGPIFSPTSEGPNYLIQNGAKLITNVSDVLEELDLQFQVNPEAIRKVMPSNSLEEEILDILDNEPLYLDEVVRISGCAMAELSARLTIMEMRGLVKDLGGGIYKKL